MSKQIKNTATLPVVSADNGRNYGDSKETIGSYVVVDCRLKKEVVTLRLYMGRSASASKVYASIWISPDYATMPGICYTAGTGAAGGWGYCKRSAATGSAIRSAGISLRDSISGVGTDAVEDALLAIAVAMGCSADDLLIVH